MWLATGDAIHPCATEQLCANFRKEKNACASPHSAWGLGALVSGSRLRLERPVLRSIEDPFGMGQIALAAPSVPVLVDSSCLPRYPPADPAGRIVIATARAMNLTILARDRPILDYSKEGHVRAMTCRPCVTARPRPGTSVPAAVALSRNLPVRDPDQPGCTTDQVRGVAGRFDHHCQNCARNSRTRVFIQLAMATARQIAGRHRTCNRATLRMAATHGICLVASPKRGEGALLLQRNSIGDWQCARRRPKGYRNRGLPWMSGDQAVVFKSAYATCSPMR